MNLKKAFVFVESPFQLLCAFEAINYLSIEAEVFVRLNNNEVNNLQMFNVVKELNFKNVHFLNTKSFFYKVYSFFEVIVFLKSRNYDYYILGDYFSKFVKVFIKFIKNKKNIILLDDGVATFEIQKNLRNFNLPLTLFTIFDNIKPFNKDQTILYNDFTFLKKKYLSKRNKKFKKINVFIGGKLVDIKWLNVNIYKNLILKCRENNIDLFYFPHRGASMRMIKEISNIKGIKVINTDLPIELYLLKYEIVPNKICSIISSALFSLSKIYKDANIIAYKPKFNDIQKKDVIDEIYHVISLYKNISIEEL